MRLLFQMDGMNYEKCTRVTIRNSSRGIIIKNNKIALIHSQEYDYYKFPGGGIEKDESEIDALIREIREEAGLKAILSTIKEYGYVHRIQKGYPDEAECFIQDNFYYFCEVEDEKLPQRLDVYEEKEGFTLEYVDPEEAILKNRNVIQSPHDQMMYEREARVLELLIAEKYI